MTEEPSAWARWQAVAARAARAQAAELFGLLYYAWVVPLGALLKLGRPRARRQAESPPAWTDRSNDDPADMTRARRQS